jgi:hypothetical protein
MTEMMWIKSHVEQLLEREWDACRVPVDDDGDYPFRHGTAMCWVTVMDADPIMVRVFAHAAYGLKPSLKLFRELNDIQRRTISCRIDFADGLVLVSQTISPIGLTQPVLAQAMGSVSSVADDVGSLLAVMFDGATPFEAQLSDSEEASG